MADQGAAPARRRLLFKKILTWLAIAFVIYFVLTEPTRAGDLVRSTASALNSGAQQVLHFFDSIA